MHLGVIVTDDLSEDEVEAFHEAGVNDAVRRGRAYTGLQLRCQGHATRLVAGRTYQGQDSCQVGSYVLVSNIHGGLILLFGGGFFR